MPNPKRADFMWPIDDEVAGLLTTDGQSALAELNDIYSDRILELAGAISRTRRLDAPDASASAHSKLCGSTVTIDLKTDAGRVTDYGQTVKACLLGQAACSVMAREIVGSTPDELRALATQMRAMLKSQAPPPAGRWSDLSALEPVRDYKGRHASVLLVFDAVVAALEEIEAKKPAHRGASVA